MKKILFLLILGLFLLLPNLVLADCVNIGGFSRFSLQGVTVILYAGSSPVARFDLQNCEAQPTSQIDPIKTDVCDGDEILIDGSRCTMMEIKSLGP